MVHAVAVHDGLRPRRAQADWRREAPWSRCRRSVVGETEVGEEEVGVEVMVEGAAVCCWVVRRGWSVRSTTTMGAAAALEPVPLAPLPPALALAAISWLII